MSCPVDGRPLINNQVICAGCEIALDRALGDLDSLLDELDITLTRQAKRRPARGNQPAPEPVMPYNIAASDTARDLRTLLKDWVSMVAEGLAGEGKFVALPMPATGRTLAAWLMNHVHWLATHDTAPDAYSEIVGAVNNIRRTIDIAPDTTFIGPCYSLIDGVECTEDVYATEHSPTARCKTCGTTHDVAARTGQAASISTRATATAVVITRSLTLGGLPLQTSRIRVWAHRGHLTPAGTGPKGHPTYIIAHVQRLIQLHEAGQKLTNWDAEPTQEQEVSA